MQKSLNHKNIVNLLAVENITDDNICSGFYRIKLTYEIKPTTLETALKRLNAEKKRLSEEEILYGFISESFWGDAFTA